MDEVLDAALDRTPVPRSRRASRPHTPRAHDRDSEGALIPRSLVTGLSEIDPAAAPGERRDDVGIDDLEPCEGSVSDRQREICGSDPPRRALVPAGDSIARVRPFESPAVASIRVRRFKSMSAVRALPESGRTPSPIR